MVPPVGVVFEETIQTSLAVTSTPSTAMRNQRPVSGRPANETSAQMPLGRCGFFVWVASCFTDSA